ncbi:hypothetical protein AK812_SmicGene34911 [Symbiodinium microadriaticum]|uniref:Uncharacterized protein n=1 Tax=Symbiodinium microadriaticum TaxID=2951 RepID=A0A1Q9CMT0_SYMMI|nr:hypothetical protein AK812_SmicGene34911 [Symbiodinium microadriaticum]
MEQAGHRRGDLLYLPSRTWHFASRSPALSAHLALTAAPLVFADLLSAAGATAEMKAMRVAALAVGSPGRRKQALDDAEMDDLLTMSSCFHSRRVDYLKMFATSETLVGKFYRAWTKSTREETEKFMNMFCSQFAALMVMAGRLVWVGG